MTYLTLVPLSSAQMKHSLTGMIFKPLLYLVAQSVCFGSWVHTGDEVIFDEKGEIFIVDRIKVSNYIY